MFKSEANKAQTAAPDGQMASALTVKLKSPKPAMCDCVWRVCRTEPNRWEQLDLPGCYSNRLLRNHLEGLAGQREPPRPWTARSRRRNSHLGVRSAQVCGPAKPAWEPGPEQSPAGREL